MWKGDQLQVSKRNNMVVRIETKHLKFRTDEDFEQKLILTYHNNPLKAYLMKRVSNSKSSFRYEVGRVFDKTDSDKFSVRSIKNFVDGRSDLYLIANHIYDRTHKLIGYTTPTVRQYLSLSNNVYITDVISDAFMFPVYLCILESGCIILFERIPRVIFASQKRKKLLENFDLLPSDENVLIFDNVVFNNFKVTEELVQKLRELETIDQMKELIQRELIMSIV
jgi:hypothetical protein